MYQVDIQEKRLRKLDNPTFSQLQLRERFDIQEWIANEPSILGEELLIIGKEVTLPSNIRIDLLAVDKEGSLVIIELKRDESGSSIEWQAIKYASYCSAFSDEDLFEIFKLYLQQNNLNTNPQEELEKFIIHEDGVNNLNVSQRIILVSRKFHSDVVSAVLWLREYDIDITCIKFEPFYNGNNLFIQPTIIIPLPEAKDYIQRKSIKKQEDNLKQISTESLTVSNFDTQSLTEKIRESLTRETPLTPRLIEFLNILLSQNKSFDREEIKQLLYDAGIGDNIEHAGRYLSNISQFLTKPANAHLRQIITFEHLGYSGSPKNNYYIPNEYRNLVKSIIERVTQ
ncbi:endonuclease NucS domain-containing protein [Neisseria animaloris]|uniref:endonuclease NucS domain-containing protein n=1 Tax=Neisseria animaloris TaxID=326522 RepID=UPI0039E0BD48